LSISATPVSTQAVLLFVRGNYMGKKLEAKKTKPKLHRTYDASKHINDFPQKVVIHYGHIFFLSMSFLINE